MTDRIGCGTVTMPKKTIEELIKSINLYKADLNNENIWKGDSGLIALIDTLAQEDEQLRKERDEARLKLDELAQLVLKAQMENNINAACDAVRLSKKVRDENGR